MEYQKVIASIFSPASNKFANKIKCNCCYNTYITDNNYNRHILTKKHI